MKTRLLILALVLLPLVGGGQAAATATAAQTVQITATGFARATLAVTIGDTVTWENKDKANHQLVSAQALFPTQTLVPGATFSYTFTKAGRFRIDDPLTQRRDQDRMTVEVSAAGLSVTLLAARPLVVYGNRVAVTGVVSSLQANEQVTISAKPCGATAATKLATVATTTGGAYAALVLPIRNSVVTAQVKAATSTALNAFVKPRLVLRKVAAGRYAVTVRGSTSFSGRAVVLQRWNAALAKWVNVRSALLVKGPAATLPTVLSKATFRATLRPRARLRVSISQFQAGSCYRPGLSNVILS